MKLTNIFSFLGFGNKSPMTAADLMSEDAKAAAAWIETVNPLRGMTAQRMQNLYDASRSGDTVHLQWLYNEIEKVDPILLICAQRRRGALSSLDWTIKTRSERRVRGFDAKLAEEQSAALEAAFGDAEMANFNDAVEHLAGSFFRGFAHVLPVWSADGLSIRRFETLDQWNFCRDIQTGTWYWNPEANAYTDYSSCRPIPDGEVVAMVAPYHIDYPAMTIYLRSAVGEKGWAKFVERFGIPPCILTLPSDIPNDQISAWRTAAEKVAEGGSGAMPNGTGVNFCDGARGINPFKDFIHNQRELVVLMSTGGMLTSLTEAGSGTLAGNAHADTWAEIRRMDSAKIGSVINRDLAGKVLDRAFPGKPHLAYFAFATEAVPSPGEVFDDAGKARTAGYLVDKAQLEEMTGYKLEKIEEPVGRDVHGAQLFNKNTIHPEHTDAISGSESKALLAAFAKDTGAAAEAVAKLLENPSPEAAAALLAKLDTLLPKDPETAEVISRAMAEEFGVQIKNKNGECESDDPAHCRVHGVPETRPLSVQLAELGYKDKADVEAQAKNVPAERIAKIVSGDLKEHCKAHEAYAALMTNPTVKNAYGKDVTFGSDMGEKYLSGRGRPNNHPDVKRLKELPLAMHAVKNDKSPELQYLRGAVHDPLNPPKGTQYVYHEKVGDGDMQCRAWVDSGKVKGWFVK